MATLLALPDLSGFDRCYAFNCVQCWKLCRQRLANRVHLPLQRQAQHSELHATIHALNVRTYQDLLTALLHLHSMTSALIDEDLVEEFDCARPYLPGEIVPVQSLGVRHLQSYTLWNPDASPRLLPCGIRSNWLDTSSVAAMLAYICCQQSPDAIILWPQDNERVVEALSVDLWLPRHTKDTALQRALHLALVQSSIIILPLIGGSHYRALILDGARRSISAFDPVGGRAFASSCVAMCSKLRAIFLGWTFSICPPELQTDSCNCSFWIVWCIQVFVQYCHDALTTVSQPFEQYLTMCALSAGHLHASGSALLPNPDSGSCVLLYTTCNWAAYQI